MFEKAANDENYAVFVIWHTVHWACKPYQKCEVVAAPFTDGRKLGGAGLIFPKQSPFLSIMNQHYWELKDAGLYERIKHKPEYEPFYLLPKQECEKFDGHPISMHKVVSLFTIFLCCIGFSLLIFW